MDVCSVYLLRWDHVRGSKNGTRLISRLFSIPGGGFFLFDIVGDVCGTFSVAIEVEKCCGTGA